MELNLEVIKPSEIPNASSVYLSTCEFPKYVLLNVTTTYTLHTMFLLNKNTKKKGNLKVSYIYICNIKTERMSQFGLRSLLVWLVQTSLVTVSVFSLFGEENPSNIRSNVFTQTRQIVRLIGERERRDLKLKVRQDGAPG